MKSTQFSKYFGRFSKKSNANILDVKEFRNQPLMSSLIVQTLIVFGAFAFWSN